MNCQKCNSERVFSLAAKCSDCCSVSGSAEGQDKDGYVPHDMGIGGGDYVEFKWCLNCGQIQGKFPLEPTQIEFVPKLDEFGNCTECGQPGKKCRCRES